MSADGRSISDGATDVQEAARNLRRKKRFVLGGL
jgi:hypothetical protein